MRSLSPQHLGRPLRKVRFIQEFLPQLSEEVKPLRTLIGIALFWSPNRAVGCGLNRSGLSGEHYGYAEDLWAISGVIQGIFAEI